MISFMMLLNFPSLSLLLSALSLFLSEGRASSTGITDTPVPHFYQGHDLSSLKLLEDIGSIYKDTARHSETRL